jgi:hypothetical protein
VATFVYVICGLLVRIRMGSHGWQIFAALGVLLGLGYLVKTAMFPLAFVFIMVGMFAVGNIKTYIPHENNLILRNFLYLYHL